MNCIKLLQRSLQLISCLLLSVYLFGQQKPGQKAAEISLPDVNNKIQNLSDLRGKVVLLDFWASWCAPCRRSNPILVKLYNKYKQKGFEIFSISIDEDTAAWKKAIITDNMIWTHVIEAGGWGGPVAAAWKIEQVPTSYLLDKSGKVVAINPSTLTLENKIRLQL